MENKTIVTRHKFSKTEDGKNTQFFRLDNGSMSVEICDYGATIISANVPDKNGEASDVVLGYSSVLEYQKNGGYFGATIGRFGNRIAKGSFALNGKEYTLFKNDGENHLHGGKLGFDKKLWDCEVIENGVVMSTLSPDGEEGYPGNLTVSVAFTLTEANTLSLHYKASADADTVLNLTNHSYFNLNGHNKGDILRHQIKINADRFTRVGEGAIPTGELPSVIDTPFDFLDFHEIGERLQGERIEDQENKDLKVCGGYDHNYVLNGEGMREAAVLISPYTGRKMTVKTDLPGMQLYIGNMIDPVNGKFGTRYGKRSGLCLETQFFPDSPNQSTFPSCVVKAGEAFETTTSFSFEILQN